MKWYYQKLVIAVMVSIVVETVMAASIKINNNAPLTEQTWTDLKTILLNAATGDIIRVSGDLQRPAGETELLIVTNDIILSGGWNTNFTLQLWTGKSALSEEVSYYSVLDANGSASDKARVLVITNTATNVRVEGFKITRGYVYGADGGGIALHASGCRLTHLHITGNKSYRDYGGAGGVYISSGNTVLEYLTVTSNYTGRINSWAGVYGGAIKVDTTATNGRLIIANCFVAWNTVSDGASYGAGIEFRGPGNPPSVCHWTIFGCLISGHPGPAVNTVNLLGRGNGRANLVNCTMVDNSGGLLVSQEGGTGNWERDNYVINCVLADTYRTCAADSYSQLKFQNTLIDPETPASGGSYFDGTKYIDLGGNIPNTQPLFKNQSQGDYRLSRTSPAKGTGRVLYSSAGLGFAYVDIDRNSSYDAGIDVIVDIIEGSGQYVPSSTEYYYPRDINGSKWISRTRYSSNEDLVGSMNMGAFGRLPAMGTVVFFK
jgi:hypothetical protein